MKNKILGLLLCLLCFVFETKGQDFSIDGINYTITDPTAQTVEVSSGSCYSGDLILTTVTNNTIAYTITSIGDSSFSGCSRLTSIILPVSLTSIGASAFSNCNNLITIDVNNEISFTIETNVLCIPARYTSIPQAIAMVETFLNTAFEGGRHQNRVDKIACS